MPPWAALQLLLLLTITAFHEAAGLNGIKLSDTFGGPHGSRFSDEDSVASGQTVRSISIRSGERVDGLILEIASPKPQTFTHGGTGGTKKTLKLGAGEYITSMEAHWDKKRGHTRIFYLNFATNAGNSISGGTQTDNKATATAPAGYQLGGFFGRDGDEIDLLGVVWTSIKAVSKTKTMTKRKTITDSDITLSEVFGGPHGLAFSDMASVKFEQTISSVTIRGDERVDQVTLQISEPEEKTWTHGGEGGSDNTLNLASGEYIDSMEVHWGKKRGHTRVFFLELGTNDGNVVSAGTKTGKSASVVAPKGFQLGGFFGRAADEVDQIGIIWARISAKRLLLTDQMGSGWNGATIRNWVGPSIGKAKDSACYRKTLAYGSSKTCPVGYNKDDNNCIATCPISYPVGCYAECIPQNDDCTLEIMQKVAAVAAAAFNVVTAGIFGALFTAYKNATQTFLCAASMVSLIRSLIYYLRFQQTTAPQGAVAELLAVAYQSDVVLFDLPIAVCNCLGIEVSKTAMVADVVVIVVQNIVKQAIINGDAIVSSAEDVLSLLTNVSAVNSTNAASVEELQDFIDSGSSCGFRLKNLTDHITASVNSIRNDTPGVTAADVRVKMSSSSLVVHDIPTVTNGCMKELLSNKTTDAAFETRDLLRKTLGVIIDQLVDTGTTDMGKNVKETEDILEGANMGLIVLAGFDPTRIAWLASQFIQPTCGPTAFVGEIDDGTLYDALGQTTVDEAFVGSYGVWKKKGDGKVRLIFESTDTKDVTVVIHSGGEDIAQVDVDAGATVTWNSTITKLQDKILYLDRWRPNALGVAGSGGGSLVLWVPRSSQGGHITLHVRVNVS